MKSLLFSTLFPNARQASHGIFVENRLRHLRAYAPDLDVRVVAPVPWFPSRHPRFGSYAQYAGVAAGEMRQGVEVLHPKYPVVPKVGMQLAPWSMYRWARGTVRRLIEQGFDFDLIDAHYFYPDGVTAMRLAKEFRRPFVVTGRGTDLHSISKEYPGPRRRITEVTRSAAHMITVSDSLKDCLLDLGAAGDRITVLRNGVDLTFFQPAVDRMSLRRELGLNDRKTLLSVGNLIELKGHHLVIEAMRQLPQFDLVVIGGGPEAYALQQLADQWSLNDRIRMVGRLSQETLRRYYQAGDALVLASKREGWANVLLESMACGTPVVATPVGGNPEVVASADGGQITRDRSANAIVDAIKRLFDAPTSREDTRRYAEGFSWDDTSRGQLEIFERVVAASKR